MTDRRWSAWARRHRRAATWTATAVVLAGVLWAVMQRWPVGFRLEMSLDRGDQIASIASAILAAGGLVLAYFVRRQPTPGLSGESRSSSFDWPHRIGLIPPAADCFLHRRVTEEVKSELIGGSTVFVSGLGGVGKTQLVASLTRQLWEGKTLDLVVWITASSRDSVLSGYAQAGVEVASGDSDDIHVAAQRFLVWLAESSRRWLIVLDDLAKPSDLQGWWPPATALGRVVVTTRRRDATLQGRGIFVTVDAFTAAEAGKYLAAKFARQPDLLPVSEASALAADLGYLPLALSHAAAYMIDYAIDCATYRSRFADRQQRLSDLMPGFDALPDDYPRPVAVTLSLSVDAADKLKPVGLARLMMVVASLLNPNSIPARLFENQHTLDFLTNNRPRRYAAAPSVTADRARDSVRNLYRLNLATSSSTTEHQTIRVHALAQRAIRDQASPRLLAEAAHATADALMHIWPSVELDLGFSATLRSCVESLRGNAELHMWGPTPHDLLFRLGESLGETGQAAAAAAYFHHLADEAATRLGPEHPDTLTAQHSHARWVGQAGDSIKARDLLARLLPARVRASGPEHPATLFVSNHLARWTGWAGDPAQARDMLITLLPHYERVHGMEHPHTLTARLELIYWTGAAGDAVTARNLLRALVKARKRVSGAEHPHTLNARHFLAFWTGQAGNPTEARNQLTATISLRRRVLGDEHRDTLRSRRDYAWWTGEAGRPATARDLLDELLPVYERVSGPQHTLVLNARLLLAHYTGRAGNATAARDMIARQLLPLREKASGIEHPDTLLARANHARWIGESGDTQGAIEKLAQLLPIIERACRSEHRITLAVRAELARWAQGQVACEGVIGAETML